VDSRDEHNVGPPSTGTNSIHPSRIPTSRWRPHARAAIRPCRRRRSGCTASGCRHYRLWLQDPGWAEAATWLPVADGCGASCRPRGASSGGPPVPARAFPIVRVPWRSAPRAP